MSIKKESSEKKFHNSTIFENGHRLLISQLFKKMDIKY